MIPAIPAIPSIASSIASAAASTGLSSTAAVTAASAPFSNILGQAVDALNGVTNNATSLSLEAAAGQATVADATVASSIANLDTQLASALASRAVSSLNSIMNMPL